MEMISFLLHRLVVMRVMIDWYRLIHNFAQLSELYSVITYGHGDHSASLTPLGDCPSYFVRDNKNLDAASITIRVFSITFFS